MWADAATHAALLAGAAADQPAALREPALKALNNLALDVEVRKAVVETLCQAAMKTARVDEMQAACKHMKAEWEKEREQIKRDHQRELERLQARLSEALAQRPRHVQAAPTAPEPTPEQEPEPSPPAKESSSSGSSSSSSSSSSRGPTITPWHMQQLDTRLPGAPRASGDGRGAGAQPWYRRQLHTTWWGRHCDFMDHFGELAAAAEWEDAEPGRYAADGRLYTFPEFLRHYRAYPTEGVVQWEEADGAESTWREPPARPVFQSTSVSAHPTPAQESGSSGSSSSGSSGDRPAAFGGKRVRTRQDSNTEPASKRQCAMLQAHPSGAPTAETTEEYAILVEQLRRAWSNSAPGLLLGQDFKKSIRQWISNESSLLIHAPSIDGTFGNVLVGGATYCFFGDVMYLILLAISPGLRRKGHGTALVAKLHEIAGARPIVMLADEHPPTGQAQSSSDFYRRTLGASGVGRVEKDGRDIIKRMRGQHEETDIYRLDEIHGGSCGAVALQFV